MVLPSMPLTPYVRKWFARADDDIRSGKILFEECLYNPVCFHAQQAAEKLFKGFLASHERHVRKTHQLDVLLALCKEVDATCTTLAADADYLDRFYMETRYPADIPEFSKEDATQALAAVQRIQEFVLSVTGAK